jgi:putative transposase
LSFILSFSATVLREVEMLKVFHQLLLIQLSIFNLLIRNKKEIALENLILRQQLGMYLVKKQKPEISDTDRSMLVAIMRVFSKWKEALAVVKPETVIEWQRKRFGSYWRKISKRNSQGRRRISREIIDLIKLIRIENNWGASRIYSELLKLGFTEKNLSQSTVARYLKKLRLNDPDGRKAQSWKIFLHNHKDEILAMDFFTVPTVSFKIQYVFFVVHHGTRKIIHANVTEHPTTQWVVQQFREVFAFEHGFKYMIHDRDSIFSGMKNILPAFGIQSVRTSFKSPWQNGIAERFVLTAKTELIHNVIVFNQRHLQKLMKEYIDYYNDDRCHLAIGRDSPNGRKIQKKPIDSKVKSIPKLGGLVHRYEWKKAA